MLIYCSVPRGVSSMLLLERMTDSVIGTQQAPKHLVGKQVAKMSLAEITGLLGASRGGLASNEAAKRLHEHGYNILASRSKNSVLKLLIKQFKNSLVYLLVAAGALSFILQDINDGIVITIILLINTSLGFYQEFRSEKAVEKLQNLVGKEVLVKRDGKDTLISEKLIVPGDLVILREGDIIPADIRLFEVNDFTVNESQLTGESLPVTKASTGSGSIAYAGSIAEMGEARGYVYATATNTELGKIAHLSSSTKRVTQFEKSLSSFSTFLMKATFITLLAIFLLKLILVHDVSQTGPLALFIVALSIAVVPEAMPVIVTVTLSRGSLRLAKQHVIAKTLTAVEDLGNITVLCTDKTGTLTENKQTVQKLISDNPKLFQKLAIASLETLDEKRKKFQSSFDQAFINYVPQNIQDEAHALKRLEELPFDPTARRRRVVCSDGRTTYLVEVGSVETLLSLTKDSKAEEYHRIIKEDGEKGLRHLGIAYKELHIAAGDSFDILKHEDSLHFVGFVALEDPLHPTAKHTIALAENLGVAIKILSGDSREVTQYVAAEVGLINKGQKIYIGDEIDALSDKQLTEIAEKNNVFARLNPEQKYRIIKLLKKDGEVVGYQGDGINDAPALKLADVAIAVSNATDVAQESADILLLRNDLGVIVNGIRSGRGIFSNINKYIRYTFVGNWGNLFALGALYLVNTSLPILAIQVLLLSLLGDIPCITIATDNVDSQELHRPSKYNMHALMVVSMILGVVTAVFEIIYFALIKDFAAPVEQTALYLFLSFTQLAVIFSVRNKGHFWQAPKLSLPMKVTFTVVSIITAIVIYLGMTQSIFSFIGLRPWLFVVTLAMTGLFFITMDTMKVWFYRSKFGSSY